MEDARDPDHHREKRPNGDPDVKSDWRKEVDASWNRNRDECGYRIDHDSWVASTDPYPQCPSKCYHHDRECDLYRVHREIGSQ